MQRRFCLRTCGCSGRCGEALRPRDEAKSPLRARRMPRRSVILDANAGEIAMSFALSRSSHAAPQAEINVTPLIDVMLALVVVFMIAAPLVLKRFTLPIGDGPSASATTEPVRLRIGADGSLSWNDQAIPTAMLREQLRLLSQRAPQPALRIDAAPAASYDTFANVLADAKLARIEHIAVIDPHAR
jgi:biopolymer transport protein ExbD